MFRLHYDKTFENSLRALRTTIPSLTGRYKGSTDNMTGRAYLTIELDSPWRWQSQVLAEPGFRKLIEGWDTVRLCLPGYQYKKRFFSHPPEYRHAVKVPVKLTTGFFAVKAVGFGDGDSPEWTPPRLNGEGLAELARLGIESDYRLGHDFVEITSKNGGRTFVGETHLLFRDFDDYSLVKLRF